MTEYILIENYVQKDYEENEKNELISMYKNGKKQAMTGLREQLSLFLNRQNFLPSVTIFLQFMPKSTTNVVLSHMLRQGF